jgi:hypothetical protein
VADEDVCSDSVRTLPPPLLARQVRSSLSRALCEILNNAEGVLNR